MTETSMETTIQLPASSTASYTPPMSVSGDATGLFAMGIQSRDPKEAESLDRSEGEHALLCIRSEPRETAGVALNPDAYHADEQAPGEAKHGGEGRLTGGWKHRNRTTKGPDARLIPSKVSALEKCILNAGNKSGAEMFAPTVGMDFDSSQEAYKLYNLFAWENGFGIRHGRTRFSTKKGDPEYQLMQEFVCQCQGRCENDNVASCRTECKASLRLLRTTDHGWYVSMFDNTHNHPLSQGREEKRQWNSHSVIDPILTDFVRSLRENNVSLGKVYNILNATHGENTGALFRKENLRYLCSRISRESIKEDMDRTRQLLEEMKVADPYLTVKVEHDNEGSVKAILWSSGKNQEDYMYFGDVVTFDTTYRTNLYNMPFGIFVGVNNHFQSIIFGGVLLREETVLGFEWAFKTFVEIMGGKPPATMLTDQCRAMETAIKNTLQTTRHRWCKWHILKCAKENLGRMYSKNYDFKKEFHSVINDILCVQEFEEKWDELLERYKLKQNKYLQNLYSNRTKWAKPYFAEIFCAGMTSTQRSESANHLLKQYIPRSLTMHLFVKQYNNLLRSRTTDEGKEQHITNMKKRKYNGGFPLEVDAAQIYTNAVYRKFEDELYASSSLVVTDCISPNEFEVKKAMPEYMVEYRARPFKVTILDDGQLIRCNCGYFEHIGMLCRHAIKIMVRNDIMKIPSHNIVKRWTRQAKEGCSGVMTMHTNATQADEIATRQNILYVAALEAVKEVALCNDMMEKALRMFREIKTEAASRRKKTLLLEPSKPISNTVMPISDATNVPAMKPPKRVKPQGRPATLRIKSRLEYVKMFTQKNKPVTSLYGDENIQPSGSAKPGFPPQANSRKSPFARTILCGRCRKPGHNRSSCKVRGV